MQIGHANNHSIPGVTGAGGSNIVRHILHADCNCYYAAVEMQRHPELRGKPVAVCGSQEDRHGIVLTASYPAKAWGVKTGQAIWQARECYPDLVVLPPDMREYIRISGYAREIYETYTDQVESFGLDECFLDVTGSVGLYGRGGDTEREQNNSDHPVGNQFDKEHLVPALSAADLVPDRIGGKVFTVVEGDRNRYNGAENIHSDAL